MPVIKCSLTEAAETETEKGSSTVAETVKSLREELGLTLEEFGERIGYSGEMIRQIEEDQAIDTILFRESVEREYGVKL